MAEGLTYLGLFLNCQVRELLGGWWLVGRLLPSLCSLFTLPPDAPLFLKMNIGFSNFSEMGTILESKTVAYKHTANGAYGGTHYVIACALAHLPIAIVESLIYSA